MKGPYKAGKSWNCSMPCSSTLPECSAAGIDSTIEDLVPDNSSAGQDGGSSGSSNFPWWLGWLLPALAVLTCIVAIVGMMLSGGKGAAKPKKKKRAVKAPAPAAAAPSAETVLESTPVSFASPVPVY